MRVVGWVPVPKARPGSSRITCLACAGGSCQVGTIQNSGVISTGVNCDCVNRQGFSGEKRHDARALPSRLGRRHARLTEQSLLCRRVCIGIFNRHAERIERFQRFTQGFDLSNRGQQDQFKHQVSMTTCSNRGCSTGLARPQTPIASWRASFDKLRTNGERWEALGATPSQTSRGRGTGFAGPQAQRPLGGQRSTRSDKRGGHHRLRFESHSSR